MARIAGVDLPREKRIEIGLTYVYGIGRTAAKNILEADWCKSGYPRERRCLRMISQNCVIILTKTMKLKVIFAEAPL